MLQVACLLENWDDHYEGEGVRACNAKSYPKLVKSGGRDESEVADKGVGRYGLSAFATKDGGGPSKGGFSIMVNSPEKTPKAGGLDLEDPFNVGGNTEALLGLDEQRES